MPRVLPLLLSFLALPVLAAPSSQPAVSFKRDVAPVLAEKCQSCHGPDKVKGDYRLDTFERLLVAGESKEAPIVPGRPKESPLYKLLTTDDEQDRMPHNSDPLPAATLATIRAWIEQGAAFDGPDKAAPLASIVQPSEQPEAPQVYRQPVPVTALAFNPAGTEIAASGYHEITIWNPEDGKVLARIPKLAERTLGLSWSPDGTTIAAATGSPGKLGEVRLCERETKSAGKALDRIGDVFLAVCFTPDGSRLAAAGADNSIRVYDAKSRKRLLLIEQHADWVTDVAFSADGARLASASRDKSARVFDAKTGTLLSAFLGHEELVYSVAWAGDDGKTIFTAGRDRKVREWNAVDVKPVGMPIGGFGEADPLRLIVAGDSLFCAAADGVIREYSLATRELRRSYSGGDWVYCIAIDPKHHRLAAGTHGGRVVVWDTNSGEQLRSFIAAPGYRGQ